MAYHVEKLGSSWRLLEQGQSGKKIPGFFASASMAVGAFKRLLPTLPAADSPLLPGKYDEDIGWVDMCNRPVRRDAGGHWHLC